ncbi:MAG: glycosyltransferase [Paludibacteraceae bacterium]|nr:glycosyltransferase [Paludibacteraceae bacterium]
MISIIIPIFNAEAFLPACLDSVVAQITGEALQIILVDDSSSDNSPAIAASYAKRHEDDPQRQIILLSQLHAGQSAARNLGIEHATGEYIAFVDADDRLAPDWCERHLKVMRKGKYDYVQSGCRRTRDRADKGWTVGPRHLPHNRYQFTSPCARLYRRELFKDGKLRFPEGMIYEDVVFSVDLWLSGAKCHTIRYAGYLYTRNPQSTTSRPHLKAQQKVIHVLHMRMHGQSLKNRLIIFYTILRLEGHFFLIG